MKVFITATILLSLCVSNCLALNYWFRGDPDFRTDGSDPNNWSNPLNWIDGYGQPVNLVPTSTDTANVWDANFVINVESAAAVKYLYLGPSGHFTVKRGGSLTARQFFFPVADSNVVVDINEGSTVSVGTNVTEAMSVGHVGNGELNVKGTLTALAPTLNWMYIGYGSVNQETGEVVPRSGTVNVSGNGEIKNFLAFYLGNNAGLEKGTLNILDANSKVTVSKLYVNGGIGEINVHDGLLSCKNIVVPWGLSDPYTWQQYAQSTMTISGNGRVIVGGGPNLPDLPSGNLLGNFVMCAVPSAGGSDYKSILNIMDANSVLDCNGLMAGEGGPATINMNGGTLTCNTLYLTYPDSSKGSASCTINAFGGTINVKKNWQPGANSMRYGVDNVHVDIRNHGKLVLPYSQYSQILGDISLGIIKSYGGTGRVIINADTAANTVTLTGCPSAGPVLGDVNNDCIVDYIDVRLLALSWLQTSGAADLNADNRINLKDFAKIASNWLYNK